jgi:hypothetical protein
MRRWAWVGWFLAAACAGRPVAPEALASPENPMRYVDERLGFEVTRPTSEWQLDVTGDVSPEGVATPVVMRNPHTGAQVVIQVAPATASPGQLAERLQRGMRAHPGFVTTEPEPVPLSDDAVGFQFAMGEGVHGRVALREGASGRMLLMLGTWPAQGPEGARAGVDRVFETVGPSSP